MINQFLGLGRKHWAWFLIWGALLVGFVALDVLNFWLKSAWVAEISAGLKYLGIVFCLIFLLAKRGSDHRLLFAIAFTLLSDTLLMWLDWELLGVGVFCFAQFFHILRLSRAGARYLPIYTGITVITFLYCIYSGVPAIYAMAFVYTTALILHVSLSAQRWALNRKFLPAACGLAGVLLFVACDINVALHFLAENSNYFGRFGLFVSSIAGFLVFIFYLPSQILLCFSGNDKMSERDL